MKSKSNILPLCQENNMVNWWCHDMKTLPASLTVCVENDLILDALIMTSQCKRMTMFSLSYVYMHAKHTLDWFITLCHALWQWERWKLCHEILNLYWNKAVTKEYECLHIHCPLSCIFLFAVNSNKLLNKQVSSYCSAHWDAHVTSLL